jgi:hypothetical protein
MIIKNNVNTCVLLWKKKTHDNHKLGTHYAYSGRHRRL